MKSVTDLIIALSQTASAGMPKEVQIQTINREGQTVTLQISEVTQVDTADGKRLVIIKALPSAL